MFSDAVTGRAGGRGTRQVTASFDRSRQYFARLRAERDAEDRAARELAEALRLAVAGRTCQELTPTATG